MKRKQARKIRSKKLQEKILWLSNYLEDNKIIIGFHHKKKAFQQLLKNYGEINQTNPNRLLARIDGNGWCRFNENSEELNTAYILKEDIQDVFLNRYVVVKNGGVYDLECEFFFTRKEFFHLKRLYEKGLVNKDLNLIDSKMAGDEAYHDWEYKRAKESNRFFNFLLHNRKSNNPDNLSVQEYIEQNTPDKDDWYDEGEEDNYDE